MSKDLPQIGVIPMGETDALVPKVIAAHVSGYLNLRARVLPPVQTPSYAFDRQRLQYNAGHILSRMESNPVKGYRKIVGVLSVDIFLPIFTRVFGEARQGGRVALVSLFHLGNDPAELAHPTGEVLTRTAKVALHEICHLFGMHHCDSHDCLMHFAGNLEELDLTPFSFCRYCASYFREAVRR